MIQAHQLACRETVNGTKIQAYDEATLAIMLTGIQNMTFVKNIFYALLVFTAWQSVPLAEETVASETTIIIPLELTNPIALGLSPGTWREYLLSGGPTDGATLRWTWLETEDHKGQSCRHFSGQSSACSTRFPRPRCPHV